LGVLRAEPKKRAAPNLEVVDAPHAGSLAVALDTSIDPSDNQKTQEYAAKSASNLNGGRPIDTIPCAFVPR
jgi:hypothetical protein